jgi:hypothetical protein
MIGIVKRATARLWQTLRRRGSAMTNDRHVAEVEAETRTFIEKTYALDIEILDNLSSEISIGCSLIAGNDHDRGVGFLHLVLFNRALNALRRAREDIVTGYAAQGLTMARSAYEDWGTICYTDRHPEIVNAWLQHLLPGIPETNTPPPTNAMIWNDLKPEIGDEAGTLYGLLCEFSHPRTQGFAWLVRYDSGAWQFTVGPQTDETQVITAIHNTMLVAGVLASRVPGLQEKLIGEPDKEWWNRIWPIMEASRKRAAENNARLWELYGFDPSTLELPSPE